MKCSSWWEGLKIAFAHPDLGIFPTSVCILLGKMPELMCNVGCFFCSCQPLGFLSIVLLWIVNLFSMSLLPFQTCDDSTQYAIKVMYTWCSCVELGVLLCYFCYLWASLFKYDKHFHVMVIAVVSSRWRCLYFFSCFLLEMIKYNNWTCKITKIVWQWRQDSNRVPIVTLAGARLLKGILKERSNFSWAHLFLAFG